MAAARRIERNKHVGGSCISIIIPRENKTSLMGQLNAHDTTPDSSQHPVINCMLSRDTIPFGYLIGVKHEPYRLVRYPVTEPQHVEVRVL